MGDSFNPQGKLALNARFIPYIKGENIYPFNVEISASGVCYETCKKCFYKNEQTGAFISREIFSNFFNYSTDIIAVTWTGGGEPTENDLLPEYTGVMSSAGKKQGLFTNISKPQNINTKDFEWIRVTCTPRNIKKGEDLSDLRSCKKIGLCVNYTGSTDDTFVDNCIAIGYKYDFDYIQIRPALEKGGQQSNVSIDIEKFVKHSKVKITGYKFEDQSMSKMYTQCEGFNFVPFIWEDGLVTVCAYHRSDPYILGDLKKDTFLDIVHRIWNKKAVPVSESCQVCCKNHEINKMLYASKQVTDVEFI
jgi:MoaA/NifB/PqqE/SkfB family radical SAM enzyme